MWNDLWSLDAGLGLWASVSPRLAIGGSADYSEIWLPLFDGSTGKLLTARLALRWRPDAWFMRSPRAGPWLELDLGAGAAQLDAGTVPAIEAVPGFVFDLAATRRLGIECALRMQLVAVDSNHAWGLIPGVQVGLGARFDL